MDEKRKKEWKTHQVATIGNAEDTCALALGSRTGLNLERSRTFAVVLWLADTIPPGVGVALPSSPPQGRRARRANRAGQKKNCCQEGRKGPTNFARSLNTTTFLFSTLQLLVSQRRLFFSFPLSETQSHPDTCDTCRPTRPPQVTTNRLVIYKLAAFPFTTPPYKHPETNRIMSVVGKLPNSRDPSPSLPIYGTFGRWFGKLTCYCSNDARR